MDFFHIWQCFFGTDFTNNKTLDQWAVKDNANKSPDMTSTWYTTNNATFELTGVQLEVGSLATDFEFKSFPEDLALCCRYFYGATDVIAGIFITDNADQDAAYGGIQFPVIMRAAPTVVFGDNAGNNAGVVTQHGAAHGIAATAGDIGKHGIGKCAKNSGNWDTGSAKPIAAKIVSADAEL